MTAPILVVAMPDSVHTLRWLQLVQGGGRPLVLLPATPHCPIDELAGLPRVSCAEHVERLSEGGIGLWDEPLGSWSRPSDDLPAPIWFADRCAIVRGASVACAVRALQPALVHSMEIQLAGYACLRAATLLGDDCPPWLVSNWGSDVYLYEKLAEHRPVLTALAQRADAIASECQRDVALLRALGFRGERLFVLPASGGADFERFPEAGVAPSSRREIVVKGYHGWSGRAMHALSALYLAAPELAGYKVRVVLASNAVADAVARVASQSDLNIALEPWCGSHASALARLASARMLIGIGISDGIGTTTLEAMALGVFPIVAATACVDEWIRSGMDGIIVDPHDVDALARAITRAATDDALVDAAALRNREVVEHRWNVRLNRSVALAMYAAVEEVRS
jgi:glycosyl transferase family 1